MADFSRNLLSAYLYVPQCKACALQLLRFYLRSGLQRAFLCQVLMITLASLVLQVAEADRYADGNSHIDITGSVSYQTGAYARQLSTVFCTFDVVWSDRARHLFWLLTYASRH